MTTTLEHERRHVLVRGIVQGVGFRPFVYGLALRHGLAGSVRNDALGVSIEVEGPAADLDAFLMNVRLEAPALAVIEDVSWKSVSCSGQSGFRIDLSRAGADRQALISPDVGVCLECLAELFDPRDRRFRYPFINCTNCGPRFTITFSVPYDRASTTMATFAMCADCQSEYDDPTDRRFHAQPNACAACGPRTRLLKSSGEDVSDTGEDAIALTAELLQDGKIVAIKGLGGYHLACNPLDSIAVDELRRRKMRRQKPFALMVLDPSEARKLADVTPQEESILDSPARPIVLLARRSDAGLAEGVAPRQRDLGIMLAYTPLHYLLLHDFGGALVMTSGNRSDEPIAYRDAAALQQLRGIADYFLVHDRPIHMRCDDSVTRVARDRPYMLRRSRGYAPRPLSLTTEFPRPILACGGELKSTFCLARGRHAFLSHHIGDLENYETLRSFQEGIDHYCRLFAIEPAVVAYDLHPEYLSTKYAQEAEATGVPAIAIQHHRAHIASCLADNGRATTEAVIGVAWDGTGYGDDGAIWGGEFFEGSIAHGFVRRARLAYAGLPGGAAAIRQPWRLALAHLHGRYDIEHLLRLGLPAFAGQSESAVRAVHQMLETGVNTPPTSSAGRLFDAVAALLNLPGTQRTTYEGQAAIELEMVARGGSGEPYRLESRLQGTDWIFDSGPIVDAVMDDLRRGTPMREIAYRFHRSMGEMVVRGCEQIREVNGVGAVALSGGTFQNMLLLDLVVAMLEQRHFTVYYHHRVPANDGGLALGQAVMANSAFPACNG